MNMNIIEDLPESGEAIDDNNTEDAATPPPLPFSARSLPPAPSRPAPTAPSPADPGPRAETATNDFEIFGLTCGTIAARKLVDSSKFPAFLIQQQEALVRSRKAICETLFRMRQAQPSPDQTQILSISLDMDPESDPQPDRMTVGPDQGPDRTSPSSDPEPAA